MRVCSIDSSRRYIKFYEIIKKEMLNICLQYLIVINIIKQECIGRVFLILIKKKLLFFDSLGLIGFQYFVVDNDESIIDKILYNFSLCKVKEEKLMICSLTFFCN